MRGDLLAGLGAIAAVLIVAIRAAIVGSDLRFLFAISMAAFFLAGLLRGHLGGHLWPRGLVISSPGLLGTAALIVNDGLHRWPIPLMISVVSVVFAVIGVQCRRDWTRHRTRSFIFASSSAACIPLFAVLFVPALVTFASVNVVTTSTRPFAIRTAAGERVNADALRGRVVVFASWASWCLPCRWELPEIDRAYQRFQGEQGVRFFVVDRPGVEETPARAKRYFELVRIGVPLAFEEPGFADALHADALPTVIILDRQGRTRLVHRGYDASEHLDRLVTQTVANLLAEPNH